jgi:hypothetical protein
LILALMPTTKRRCSTKVAKLSTVHEDTQYNADIMFADDDEAVTCAQWDATAHWNTSDWKRFARSLVNRGFVDRYDFSLSVREVCEAKDEENEQAEKALMIAEEKLATESSPGLTAHEMSLSSEALCLRARQEVVGQTGTANQLLDAAINACCAFSDRHCAKDLTRAREALLESVKPIIGAAKAQRILDDIIKNFPPLLKGLHSQPEKKLTQLMALSAQLRDVVVWNICAEMKDPKDRDFFLMMMGQAFLPHDAANDTILRAQILLAYHRIEIYKFHGFKSNNWLVTQRRKHPRPRRRKDWTNADDPRSTRNEAFFSQSWPQCPQFAAASSSPSPVYVNVQMAWGYPVADVGPQFLNTDLDPCAPPQWAEHVLPPAPIRNQSGKTGKGKSKRNG